MLNETLWLKERLIYGLRAWTLPFSDWYLDKIPALA